MASNRSVLYNKLKSIVGSENVTDKEIILDAYMGGGPVISAAVGRDRASQRREAVQEKKPGFVVRAGSTEEVQEIVRLANQYKVPIIPLGAFTSTYYETTPTEGCIMLDLSRMKKIELDEESKTVTLEPGVTWAQAYRELAMKGYWVSNQASPGSVSILGTTSQAGMHLPWDKLAVPPIMSSYYSDLTLGTEIVLPTGELLVTGSAALPGVKPRAERAYGPGLAHIFLGAQGTLGIVVKQTLPLWPIPEVRLIVTGLFTHENFKGLSNSMYRIMSDVFGGGPVWAERVSAFYDGTYRQEWEFYMDIYGSKELVKRLREYVEGIITEEGGTLYLTPRLFEPENTPSPQGQEEVIFWRPRAGSINMPVPGVASAGVGGRAHYQKIPELYDAMLKIFAKHGIPISRFRRGGAGTRGKNVDIQSVSLSYNYDLNDAEEAKRAKAIAEEWPQVYSEITGEEFRGVRGFSAAAIAYRVTPETAKTAMPMLGEYYKLLVKLKHMLDPNRIMNPGKLMDLEPY